MNDPKWNVWARAIGIDGAYFVAPQAISRMFNVKPEPGQTCPGLLNRHGVTVTMLFYVGDQTAAFQVKEGAIHLAE